MVSGRGGSGQCSKSADVEYKYDKIERDVAAHFLVEQAEPGNSCITCRVDEWDRILARNGMVSDLTSGNKRV